VVSEGARGSRLPQQDHDYVYILFDPAVAASPILDLAKESSTSDSNSDDHELFV
jgi:hypothetical protein